VWGGGSEFEFRRQFLHDGQIFICYYYCSHFMQIYVSNYLNIYFIFQYSAFKRTIEVFLTTIDGLDELKAQLNRYFVRLGENQRTSHVFVQVPCVNLAMDKDEGNWKTVYFPKVIHDDGNVDYMFRLMVENNILHICVRSIEL